MQTQTRIVEKQKIDLLAQMKQRNSLGENKHRRETAQGKNTQKHRALTQGTNRHFDKVQKHKVKNNQTQVKHMI